jgi:thymidylate synthase
MGQTPLSEEQQYLNLITEIMQKGTTEQTRNGTTKSIFGHMMRFSLVNGTIPILTTKRVAWKTCFRELMWFIRGQTDNQILQSQNVKIWNDNSTREFLDRAGLPHLSENDLGPVYGHQWRHFNAEYTDCHTDYTGKGVDQLQHVIDLLKNPETRNSRRIVMSAWNPCQIKEMALPPCHILAQFSVSQGKYLSCALYQRSGDVGLGIPFNIASYSFLTHLIARYCGLEAQSFIHFIGDAHIYLDHMEPLQTQLQRVPYPFPQIRISKIHDSIQDYSEFDIEWITPYVFHDPIVMEMVA